MAGDGDLIINIDAELSGVNSKLHELSGKVDELGQHSEEAGKKGGFLENAFSFATGGLITAGIQGIGGALSGMFGDSIQQSKDAAAGQAQLDAVLQSTGGAAGVTKDQVNALVDSLSANGGLSTASDDATLGGENMLLTFTNIGKDVFPQATQTMLDMATAMNNGAAPGAAQLSAQAVQLGKALNDPIAGIGALSKVGVSFSDDQKKVIATMQDTGDMAGAQKVILDELSKEFGGSAAAAAGTFDGQMTHLGAVFDNVKQAIGDKLMPILTGAMSWLGSPAVIGVIQGVADTLINGLGKAFDFIGKIVNSVWPVIQPFFQNLLNFWQTIASGGDPFAAFGGYISNLVGLIGNALPGIIGQLGQWAQAFWNWIVQAMPGVLSGLGTLIGNVLSWIGTNGPGILAQLAIWTGAFLNWALTDLLPKLLGWLGQIIGGIWDWITTNGPSILAKLWEWTQAFFNWVMSDVLPKLPGWLGNIVTAVWDFITTNGPTILAKLWEWTQAFFNWVMSDVLPKLPGWLGSVINAVWTFITQNGPTILAKLGEWTTAFFNWVMTDVVPKIPGWLGSIASKLWEWITNTAKDLGSKLVNEWIPAFWNWITGPGGVLANIGAKLGEIWTSITTWIGNTAHDILTAVGTIGSNIVDGIKNGITGAWDSFVHWVEGLLGGMVDTIKHFFGISSPSRLMADEVGAPLATGIQSGWDSKWGEVRDKILSDMKGLADKAKPPLPQDQAPFTNPANSPGPNALPGTQPGGALTGGDYPGNGRVPVGGGGGSNGGSRSLGFTSAGGGGGVNIAVYVDGARWSIERVAQEMGLDFRVTTAGGRV